MADLRAAIAPLGYEDIRTVLQTGNLLFRTGHPAETVKPALDAAICAAFGPGIALTVRADRELDAIVAACPFVPAEGESVYVGLFIDPPAPGRADRVLALAQNGADRLGMAPGHVYVLYRHGMTASPYPSDWIERHLGVAATFRNLRTLRNMTDMLRSWPS